MKTRRMFFLCAVPIALCAAAATSLLIGPAVAQSEDSAGKGIAFLTLLRTQDGVRLIDWTIAKGALRQPRTWADRGNLEYEAVGAQGDVVWRGSLSDPSIRRLEYEDPAHPGRLLAKFITLDSARFVVRVPADSAIDHITFYRVQRKSEGGEKTTKVRQPLGSFACPWREVKK